MIKKDSMIFLCIFVLSIQLTVYPGKANCSEPGIAKDPLAAIKVNTTKLEDKNLNKMDNDQKAKADTYEKMVERSLVSTGNNYRMKKAIEKANKGQELTMVYLGGSITEGYNGGPNGCYAKLSYDYFSQTFGTGNNVKYINAGMAGTPSTLGLIRVERDVLQYKPDIVFVEFAVNDSKNNTNMTAFESLLIRLLTFKTEPAVILLFTLSETGYSCQNEMERIGKAYALPMISVKDALTPEFNSKRMTWRDYSDDYIHPDRNGHKLITEFIKYYFITVNTEDQDSVYQLPKTTVYGNQFTNLKMLDSSNAPVSSVGGFTEARTIKQFPKGWIHKIDAPNESFILNLDCKNLFLVYKESKNTITGAVEVYVDGVKKLHVNGYNSSGWNNPVTKLVFSDETVNKHQIEIKMAEGAENKEFTILAWGYCDE